MLAHPVTILMWTFKWRKEILLSGCVCVINIIALFFVWNIYFSIWCMYHMLFGVSLKFTRAISTGTLLVIFKDSISTPKKKKKKNPTPSLVNDESFWLPRKIVNPYSKFGIHFTRKKKVRYSFYFVPRSDFLTPTSIYIYLQCGLLPFNHCK